MHRHCKDLDHLQLSEIAPKEGQGASSFWVGELIRKKTWKINMEPTTLPKCHIAPEKLPSQ